MNQHPPSQHPITSDQDAQSIRDALAQIQASPDLDDTVKEQIIAAQIARLAAWDAREEGG